MKFQIEVIKSKIHRVTVTQADLNYVGSITIDEALLEAANIIEGEKVQIMDINNGERFETYVIKGERASGCICLNGAAARKVQVGGRFRMRYPIRWLVAVSGKMTQGLNCLASSKSISA